PRRPGDPTGDRGPITPAGPTSEFQVQAGYFPSTGISINSLCSHSETAVIIGLVQGGPVLVTLLGVAGSGDSSRSPLGTRASGEVLRPRECCPGLTQAALTRTAQPYPEPRLVVRATEREKPSPPMPRRRDNAANNKPIWQIWRLCATSPHNSPSA